MRGSPKGYVGNRYDADSAFIVVEDTIVSLVRRSSSALGSLKDGIVGAFARTEGELVVSQVQAKDEYSQNLYYEEPIDGFVRENGSCWDPNTFGILQLVPCTKNAQLWTKEPSQALESLYLYRPIVKGLPFVRVTMINDTKYLLPTNTSNLLTARACDSVFSLNGFLRTEDADCAVQFGPERYVHIDKDTGECVPVSTSTSPIANCRPECFAPSFDVCNISSPTALTHFVCRNFDTKRGPIAALIGEIQCDSDETYNIVQDGGIGATATCVNGFIVLDGPGLNYSNGNAALRRSGQNGDEITIAIAAALIQPYSTNNAVFGIGIDVINISEFTSLFGRAFEAVLFKAETSKGYYTAASGLCIAAATVLFIISIHRIITR